MYLVTVQFKPTDHKLYNFWCKQQCQIGEVVLCDVTNKGLSAAVCKTCNKLSTSESKPTRECYTMAQLQGIASNKNSFEKFSTDKPIAQRELSHLQKSYDKKIIEKQQYSQQFIDTHIAVHELKNKITASEDCDAFLSIVTDVSFISKTRRYAGKLIYLKKMIDKCDYEEYILRRSLHTCKE